MKKLFISAFAMLAVALGFTACSSDDELVNETSAQGKKVTVIASTEEPGQRTALQQDGDVYKVVWSENDKIRIGSSEFTLSSGAGTTRGTFTGPTLTALMYSVYYPATYDHVNWPTAQTYTAGNITGSPMYATFENTTGVEPSITFRNEGGILRLNLKGYATIKVTKIEVSATDLNPITLDCGTGVALNESTYTPFHIAVPGTDAGTAYSGLKIVITYKDAADQSQVCTKKANKAITIQRSMITDINLSPEFNPGYLCFEAEEANAKICISNINGGSGADLQYSTDLKTWTKLGTTTGSGAELSVTLTNVGDKVYFKGNNAPSGKPNPRGFNQSTDNYSHFDILQKVSASGNVMSLLDPSCKRISIPSNYCFYRLFLGCKLTKAPKLPATILADYCYKYMFKNCTDLTQAPELPATNLAKGCYEYMFEGCTSLVNAPELPATTLAEGCYWGMFNLCTSLVNAPELPASKTVSDCYRNMFYGCKSLKSITCLVTQFSLSGTVDWVHGVGNDGTFTMAAEAQAAGSWNQEEFKGSNGIPSGWTVKTR